jgi:hypothetical protein
MPNTKVTSTRLPGRFAFTAPSNFLPQKNFGKMAIAMFDKRFAEALGLKL